LPLRKPSAFGEPKVIRLLLQLSRGVTGKVTGLLGRAAELAISESTECIDAALIERIGKHQSAIGTRPL
jgi:hypothetical protein